MESTTLLPVEIVLSPEWWNTRMTEEIKKKFGYLTGDVKQLRQHLPNTFFNIRLSPVEIISQGSDEIKEPIIRLVEKSGNPQLQVYVVLTWTIRLRTVR